MAEHMYSIKELSFLCELYTNEDEKYIDVDLHKLIRFWKGVTFYRFVTSLKTYLKFMSGVVEVCLKKYEMV